MKVAILVDGGFYRKRAAHLYKHKTPEKRAAELVAYCKAHINMDLKDEKDRTLYRVFYYDCPPIEKSLYHPLLKKNINMSKQDTYQWTIDFLNELKCQRKFALRLGVLSDERAGYPSQLWL